MNSFIVKKIVCKYRRIILHGYYDGSNKSHSFLYGESFGDFWEDIRDKKYVILVNKANRKWNYIIDEVQKMVHYDEEHEEHEEREKRECNHFRILIENHIIGTIYKNHRYVIIFQDGSVYKRYKWLPFFTSFNLYDAHYMNKQIQGGEIVFSYIN